MSKDFWNVFSELMVLVVAGVIGVALTFWVITALNNRSIEAQYREKYMTYESCGGTVAYSRWRQLYTYDETLKADSKLWLPILGGK